MKNKKTGWGGPRPGAGPPVRFEEGLIRKTVTLPASDVEYLTRLGDGNLSQGIRRLVEMARRDSAGES